MPRISSSASMRTAASEPPGRPDAVASSRAAHWIVSLALHGALAVGLYVITQQRAPGIGVDYTVVELSMIPGLERLLEEQLPTGSEATTDVTPEPEADSTDTVPEPAIEQAELEAGPQETPAPAPEPGTSDESAAPDVEPPATVELADAPPEPAPAEAPTETEAIETELDPTDLRAVVVSTTRLPEPQPLPNPAPEPEPVTTPISASEQAIVEHHVTDWAESFAALAEWQPSTTWVEDDRAYSATVTRVPAPDNMGVEQAIVTVTTEREGQTFSTEVRMQRLGFSHFAQFIDRWDPEVQIHDDRIDGRFHSNSEIKISRSGGVQPVFHGKVTTARGIDTSRSDRRVRRDEVFLGGLETRVGRIMLPRRVPIFADDAAIPEERIQRFATSAQVEFHADGSFTWMPIEGAGPALGGRLGSEPFYLIAEDDAELHVKGVVDGKVLVYSPEAIIIEGDLVYAVDPSVDPSSDDYLGLVSEGSIEVATADVTGPGDLSINAAIYARARFAVRGFRSRRSGTLFLHGSITAGSITATEPRFSTNLTFDTRLDSVRPPSFPVTDRFEIAEWDGRWIHDDEPSEL